MAKMVEVQQKWHAARILADDHSRIGNTIRGEMTVSRGRNGYLWVGPVEGSEPGGTVYCFTGRQTVRKFAQAILDAIPAAKPRRKAKRSR